MVKYRETTPAPMTAPATRPNHPLRDGMLFNFEQVNIMSLFQRLWTQLAVFMRASIEGIVSSSPSAPFNAARLLSMTRDFRNTLMLFYRPGIADQFNEIFTSFLARPINIAHGFTTNNQDHINQSVQDWYSDADELSIFLSSINLYWDEFQWRVLYIQLKLQMITSSVARDYEREIQLYDRVFDTTTLIGTYMARGLITQESQNGQS